MEQLSLSTRPQGFHQVVGQPVIEQIVSTLEENIQDGTTPQGMLLSGPRGTGKTTTGRLIAKYLNCVADERTLLVCDCRNCQAITELRFLDLIELDGASHNKVEDVEAIIDHAYSASIAKYKVILIDEAHMLTTAASNKLLKTLEEPPPRTLFLLATTEEHKILPTIRSRLKLRRFHLVSSEILAQHVRDILDKVGRKLSDKIVEYVVADAQGSVRDAMTTLDAVLEIEDPTIERILSSSGASSIEQCLTLLEAASQKKTAEALLSVDQYISAGTTPSQLLAAVEGSLQQLIYVLLEIPVNTNSDAYTELARRFTLPDVIKFLDTLNYWRHRFLPLSKWNLSVAIIQYTLNDELTSPQEEEEKLPAIPNPSSSKPEPKAEPATLAETEKPPIRNEFLRKLVSKPKGTSKPTSIPLPQEEEGDF